MPASGFTPISLYYSSTGAAVPSAGNLVAGELALNTNDGKLYYKNSSGVVTLLAGATSGPAGGSTTQVQYNNAGVLAGITGATTNGTALTLTAPVLGTPASGTVTNLTGTASININGTVGATTPAAGAFTTVSATGEISIVKAAGGAYFTGDTAATAQVYSSLINAGGQLFIGVAHNGTTGGVIEGAPAYDALIRGGTGISFSANAGTSAQMRLTSTGLAVTGTLSSTTGANFATSSGNVGIGTASPIGKLDILSNGNATQSNISQVAANGAYMVSGAYTANNYYPMISVRMNDNNPTIVNAGMYAQFTNNGSSLILGGSNSYGDGIDPSLFIQYSGNVGIGTTSPINNAGYGGLTLNGTSGALFSMMTNGTESSRIVSIGNETSVQCTATTGFISFVQGVSGGTERARIDSSGNLLVGTTAVPNVGVTGQFGFSVSSTEVVISKSGADGLIIRTTSGSSNNIRLYNLNSQVGSVSTTTTATTYNTSSDYRLKENVQPMTGALAIVTALKPVTFNWKTDGSDGQGFIAHELQAVVPDCVTGEKDAVEMQQYEISPAVPATLDEEGNELTAAVEAVMGEREVPKYQGIDTSFLVATLTAAIQELKTIIDTQATRITALEAK